MEYVANPVHVAAQVIVGAGPLNPDGTMDLALDSGRSVTADQGQLARYHPKEGDYWVTQEDGYVYINPKAVFERKYSPVVGGPFVLAASAEPNTRSSH